MARLHMLLQSFVTAVVRHHATSIPGRDDIPEDIIVKSLLDATGAERLDTLQSMLRKSIAHSDHAVYQYLLHGISVLQSIAETQDPITDEVLLSILASMTQLVVDIQTLLLTSNRSKLQVTYKEFGVDLYLDITGLNDVGWITSAPTATGKILRDILFPTLKLSPTASHEALASTIKAILKEHQKQVLWCYKEKEIERLKEENARLKDQCSSLGGLLPPLSIVGYCLGRPLMLHSVRRRSDLSSLAAGGMARYGFHAHAPVPKPLDLSEIATGATLVREQDNSP